MHTELWLENVMDQALASTVMSLMFP
jgi:hypothetical protein